MRIDSMDASSNKIISRPQESREFKTEPVETHSPVQMINSIIDNKAISQITDYEKNELPVPEKIVISAIEKANKAISGGNRRFEFSIHEKTKEIMVRVVDSDSGKVIREIPSEKTLDMVAKMWEMAGIMVDERR